MAVSQVVVGKTPNGGVRSITYYKNSKGDPVDKKKATHVEILEFDVDGNVLQRTYGTI